MAQEKDITLLLNQFANGDQHALNEALPFIYKHLNHLARNIRSEKGSPATLNTTALVHEAYLKLVNHSDYKNRLHFFRIAARAMRQIIFNYAEHKHAQKRGGKQSDISLDGLDFPLPEYRWEEAISIEQGLKKLEKVKPRLVEVVECRFFGGLNVEETAEVLNLSNATVKRDWNFARSWLYRFLQDPKLSA